MDGFRDWREQDVLRPLRQSRNSLERVCVSINPLLLKAIIFLICGVSVLMASSHPPNLAMLNCETDSVLCHAWALSPPEVLHLLLPQPLADQSTAFTTMRSIPLNRTTVTAPEIAAIHLQEKYLEKEPYQGFWHPFDGPLAKNGLSIPLGYFLWAFSQVPSWAFMIVVSIVSRTVM